MSSVTAALARVGDALLYASSLSPIQVDATDPTLLVYWVVLAVTIWTCTWKTKHESFAFSRRQQARRRANWYKHELGPGPADWASDFEDKKAVNLRVLLEHSLFTFFYKYEAHNRSG